MGEQFSVFHLNVFGLCFEIDLQFKLLTHCKCYRYFSRNSSYNSDVTYPEI